MKWPIKWPTDPRQKRAGLNILRFFALVLIVTLVARGTAGATLAKVQLGSAAAGEIVEKYTGAATVKAGGSHLVKAPEGLSLEEILADPGQPVEPGDPLLRFATGELEEMISREDTALRELELKLKQLERGEAVDGTTLTEAQRRLERARQDQSLAADEAARAKDDAEDALNRAKDAKKKAEKKLDELKNNPDAPPEELEAAAADLEAKRAARDQAESALEDAKRQAEDGALAAARAVEDAEAGLASAQFSAAESQKAAADTAAQNKLAAETQRLDIQKQSEKLEALRALQQAGGVLYADAAGTVAETMRAGEKTAEGAAAVRLDTSAGGWEAEMVVPRAEAENIQVGQECQIALDSGSAYYRPTVTGGVTAISAPDENDKVTLTLKLPEGEWRQGQSLDAQLVQSRQNHSLCLPLSAVRSNQNGTFVLVMEEQSSVLGLQNTLVEVPVTVTAQDSQNAAVESALLGPDDRVVTGSTKPVEPGDRVRVSDS